MIKLCLGGLHTQCTNKHTEEFKGHFAEMAHRHACNLGNTHTHTHKMCWIWPHVSFLSDRSCVVKLPPHVPFQSTCAHTRSLSVVHGVLLNHRTHQIKIRKLLQKNPIRYLCGHVIYMSVLQAYFKTANLTCTHELIRNTAALISHYQFS